MTMIPPPDTAKRHDQTVSEESFVQVRNPVSKRWAKLDMTTGRIVAEGDDAWEGVPVWQSMSMDLDAVPGPSSGAAAARVDAAGDVQEAGREVDEVLIEPGALQDLLTAAYIAGCEAVHANYQPDTDPEFGEAAWDYVASLDFTETTRPHRAAPSAGIAHIQTDHPDRSCGAIECCNNCGGDGTFDNCPYAKAARAKRGIQ